ncbi:MAG TPA: FAD-dependent oxidoreductase [Planctomycetaceae bacterium]|nr:FAD-dependent oxidoreductase [Planctomycetaceae bacterium]
MHATIIGAGIGGLSAAIALARQGVEVSVLEQAPSPRPVGAGISLQPNALECLRCLGVLDSVMNRACSSVTANVRHFRGRIIRQFDFSTYEERFGHLPCTIHRADLFECLADFATSRGAKIHFGQPFMRFEDLGNQVVCVTESMEATSELLIGADGIQSAVRDQLLGKQPLRYSGYLCWRGISDDPALAKEVDKMCEYWGHQSRFGCMRCNENQVYWFATRDQASPEPFEDDWHRHFEDWDPLVSRLIHSTDPSRVHVGPISDRPPTPAWTRGRVALLGDAAHPMTPNLGQGGGQAIEDAIILSMALERHKDLRKALVAYAEHRFPRTTELTNMSQSVGKLGQGSNAWKRFVRNHIIGRMPISLIDKTFDKQFRVSDHWDAFSA